MNIVDDAFTPNFFKHLLKTNAKNVALANLELFNHSIDIK
jgi:hypothetical protein